MAAKRSDSELVAAVREGEREAYGLLVERHRRAIYARCHDMTGNAVDAEELAHQAFVAGFVKLGQLRDPAKFLPWLRTLTLNLCRTWYRERCRQQELTDEDAVSVSGPEPEPEYAHLAWGLAQLSRPHRVILVLRYFEKLSYEDIATFLDVPIGTIMSRLHRAHQALKEVLESAPRGEEMDIETSPEDFRSEVEAEISVLLELAGTERDRRDVSAPERLATVLRNSPERLVQLLRDTDQDHVLDCLARVLPHLGKAAIQAMLGCCLSEATDDTSARAGLVIERYIARCRSNYLGASVGGGTPSRNPYLLIDALIGMNAPAHAKAALLLDLVCTATDEGVIVLLTNALLCYPKEALPLLTERYWSAVSNEGEDADVLHALCRTGSAFCAELAARVGSSEPAVLAKVLNGLLTIARALETGEKLHASPLHLAHDRRTRRKWAPLLASDIDPEAWNPLLERTVELLEHPAASVRETALAILGKLQYRVALPSIERAAAHPELSTRKAAVLALGDLGGSSCEPLLIAATSSSDPGERLVAIRALARLRIEDARQVLTELLTDPSAEVRSAALSALGDLGGPESEQVIKGLLSAPDARMRKAAAKILASRKRLPRAPSDLEIERQQRAGLASSEAFTDRSLDAAIRYAIPEVRAYDHREFTQRLAGVCTDFASTRRLLIGDGLMERQDDTYALTPLGETIWRVEHFIMEHYMVNE